MDFHFRCRCHICENNIFHIDLDTKGETVALICGECGEAVALLPFFDFKEGVKKADEEAYKPFD